MTLDRLEVRRAVDERDAETVHALLAAAGRDLARQGFRNWDPPYPIERVRADVREREVYVAYDGAQPVAAYTLATAPVRPYAPEPWPARDGEALYLNRLAVDPTRQGRGIGGWCLARVAERAREVGAAAVRCDVLTANAALRAFYERHGYAPRGERSHSGWTFTCYELVVDGRRGGTPPPAAPTESSMPPTIIAKKASNWVDRGEPALPVLVRVLEHLFDRREPGDRDWLTEHARIVEGMVAADATEHHVAGYLRSLARDLGLAPGELAGARFAAIALWHAAKAALVRDFAERVLRREVPPNEPTPDTLSHWLAERLLTPEELAAWGRDPARRDPRRRDPPA